MSKFKVDVEAEDFGERGYWINVTHNGHQYSSIRVYDLEELSELIGELEKARIYWSNKNHGKTAEERANELFRSKWAQLPELAIEYNRHLNSLYGGCGEVAITAFMHYVQAVEGLRCSSPGYQIDERGKEWFKERGYL